MSDQSASVAGDVGLEWGQNFQQCLELLRGPGDERRPAQVAPAALSAEAAAHQVTSCGLALAILAAACRLPDFAAGPDVRELLPVLIQVVQHGGVSRVLHQGSAAAASVDSVADDTDAADANAVSDALECLVGAAAAAPEQTLTALEHYPALDALAAWLTAAAAALTSVPPPSAAGGGGRGAAAAESPKHTRTLLASALLERMLSGSGGSGSGRAIAVLAEHPAAAARIMAALAALVGNPRLRLPVVAAASPGTSAEALAPKQQQQGTDAAASQDAQSSERKDGGGGGSSSGGGAAQLQLEALHLLLLMLRACQEPAAAAAVQELVRLDEQEAWSAAVKRGLGWLLRSRVPPALRHSALQLGALVLDLVGERWLLGDLAAAAAGPSFKVVREREEPGSFLLLLVETLKIETGLLLLQDALNPDRPVPAVDSHRSYALGQAAAAAPSAPAPSQRMLDELAARAAQRRAAEEAAVKAVVDSATGEEASASEPPRLPSPLPPKGDAAALTAVEMEVEAGEGPEGPDAPGEAGTAAPRMAAAATTSSGQRALTLLPACFRLLEGSVEAVAADAAAADGHMEMEVEVRTGAGQASAGARLPSPPQPVLADVVLQKLMGAFDSIADILLQFFEAAIEQQQQQEQKQRGEEPQQPQQGQQQQLLTAAPAGVAAAAAAATPSTRAPAGVLLLGAARVLGRYLAEAPGAVRSERMLRVLPEVMAARGGNGGGGGGGGGAAPRDSAEAMADLDLNRDVDRDLHRDLGQGDEGDLDDFALPFVLPGLLQATGPGADGRSETAKALRESPTAMDACVSYLAQCVKCAMEAAPHAERLLATAAGGGGGARGAGAGAAALAALLRSERGMADVSMLLLNLLEPSVLGSLAAGRGGAEGAAPAAGAGGSRAWAVLQRCGVCAGAGEAQAAAATAATEAAAATHLPPLLAQLLPVCWLVQRWAAAREGTLRALLVLDPLRLPGQGNDDGIAIGQLFRSQLGTRALLCTACLAAVTLAATMSRLATSAVSTAAAASAILPPPVVEGIGAAALAAAAAGASLDVAQLHDAAAVPPPPYGGGDVGGSLPLTPAGLAEDFPGDGEVCWERLLGACAQLVEMSGAVRRLAAAAGGGDAAASWLQRLAVARARGEPAATELLMSEVNLALLMQVVAANAQGG